MKNELEFLEDLNKRFDKIVEQLTCLDNQEANMRTAYYNIGVTAQIVYNRIYYMEKKTSSEGKMPCSNICTNCAINYTDRISNSHEGMPC